MSFNPKNPIIAPKITKYPPTPMLGTDGLFPMSDGWYSIDDSGQIHKIVLDNNYVHTDENYTAEDKQMVYDTFIIAENSLQAVCFPNYSMLWFVANNGKLDSMRAVGQPLFIKEAGVPDLWISAINEDFVAYDFVSNEDVISTLNDSGSVTVGYYEFRQFEGSGKVDLTEYSTTEEMNEILSAYAEKSKVDELEYNLTVNYAPLQFVADTLTDYSTTEEMNAAIAAAIGDVLGGAS